MLNDVFEEEKRSLPQKTGGYYPIFGFTDALFSLYELALPIGRHWL
jgi:hypothetical protein